MKHPHIHGRFQSQKDIADIFKIDPKILGVVLFAVTEGNLKQGNAFVLGVRNGQIYFALVHTKDAEFDWENAYEGQWEDEVISLEEIDRRLKDVSLWNESCLPEYYRDELAYVLKKWRESNIASEQERLIEEMMQYKEG